MMGMEVDEVVIDLEDAVVPAAGRERRGARFVVCRELCGHSPYERPSNA